MENQYLRMMLLRYIMRRMKNLCGEYTGHKHIVGVLQGLILVNMVQGVYGVLLQKRPSSHWVKRT
jgi:hypothetical protein